MSSFGIFSLNLSLFEFKILTSNAFRTFYPDSIFTSIFLILREMWWKYLGIPRYNFWAFEQFKVSFSLHYLQLYSIGRIRCIMILFRCLSIFIRIYLYFGIIFLIKLNYLSIRKLKFQNFTIEINLISSWTNLSHIEWICISISTVSATVSCRARVSCPHPARNSLNPSLN